MRQMTGMLRTLAVVLAMLGGAAAARAEPVTITLLQVSDWDRVEGLEGRGGFARLIALLGRENVLAGGKLLIHSGDAISPSLLSGFDKGAHMIAALNQLPIAAMALGNHEFDFGPEIARQRVGEANFPIVASNVAGADGKPMPGTVENLIVEARGYKLGFFGLTTPDTAALSSPGPFIFKPILETAAAQAKKLRDAGADLVIAIAHTGKADDRALFDQGAADIILTGHDHDLMVLYDGRVAMMESGYQADLVGALDITVDRVRRGERDVVVWRPSFRTLDSTTVTPDPQAQALVTQIEQGLAQELDVEIGRAAVELDSRRAAVRSREAAIGNLIADAMREAVDAQVGLMNGGGIRADKLYPAGTVLKRRDVLGELPFGNRTVKLEVTGAMLQAALENGVSQVEQGAGRFPQVSGMSFAFDAGRPAGSRVTAVTVGGKPLDPAATYTLATNDFIARGGDGYAMLKDAKVLIDPAAAQLMASQVIDLITAAKEVTTKVEGRITRAN
jgi:2',3'-cyclic-nucleotide 2'-phosphodiesterase (5'-nucleotidase family)